MKRRTLVTTAGLFATGGLSGCVDEFVGTPESESVSRTYAVTKETRVLISNRNGPVSVQRASGSELTISGEKQAGSPSGLDSLAIDVVEGERFVINVRFSSGSDFSNQRVNLSVGIPDGVAVDLANTANGDVTVSGVRGDVNAATVNGSVAVTDVTGFVRGDTTNGDVRIRNCSGVVGARTSSGTVDVDLAAMRGDVTCYSSNGNVSVQVGPEVSAAIRLSTNTGTVQIRNLPYMTTIERKGYVVGSLRGGTSPLLFLGADNGDVTLRAA